MQQRIAAENKVGFLRGGANEYRKEKTVPAKNGHGKKGRTKLPGVVEKVIKPVPGSGEPEKAQIAVEGADHLYRELRVPNKLVDEDGHKVKLEKGAEVEVHIESEGVTAALDSSESHGPQPS